MVKKLVKHRNSWTVVIVRPILDLLKIALESQVESTTDGKSIRIALVSVVRSVSWQTYVAMGVR